MVKKKKAGGGYYLLYLIKEAREARKPVFKLAVA